MNMMQLLIVFLMIAQDSTLLLHRLSLHDSQTIPVNMLFYKMYLSRKIFILKVIDFFFGVIAPYWALASPSFTRIFVVSRSHTMTHHSG